MYRVQLSSVKWNELVNSQLLGGRLRFSRCELLPLEADSWGTAIFRGPTVRGKSYVQSRYQTTTCEDTADWKDLVRAVVNFSL
jgi:hypothetical protein